MKIINYLVLVIFLIYFVSAVDINDANGGLIVNLPIPQVQGGGGNATYSNISNYSLFSNNSLNLNGQPASYYTITFNDTYAQWAYNQSLDIRPLNNTFTGYLNEYRGYNIIGTYNRTQINSTINGSNYRTEFTGNQLNDSPRFWTGADFRTVPEPTLGDGFFQAQLANVGAGNVDNCKHYYSVTYYTALGETTILGQNTIVYAEGWINATVIDKTVNGKVNLSGIPVSSDPRVVGRKLYRSKCSGIQPWLTYQLTTITNNVQTEYIDNIADSGLTGSSGSGYNNADTTNPFITVDGAKSMFLSAITTKFGVNSAPNSVCTRCTFIGQSAGLYTTNGQDETCIGDTACQGGMTSGSGGNTVVGSGALRSMSTTATSNSVLGTYAGYCLASAGNAIVGDSADYISTSYCSTGNYNSYFGHYAGRSYSKVPSTTYAGCFGAVCFPWKSNQNVFGTQATDATTTLNTEIFGDTRIIKTNSASLGIEKLNNPSITGSLANWTNGTGWTYGTNNAQKSYDGTGTLSQSIANMNTSIVVNEMYYVKFTISGYSAGTVTPSIGGEQLPALYSNAVYEYVITATNTNPLTFTPTNTARFTLDDISVKKINGGDLRVAKDIYAQGNITGNQIYGEMWFHNDTVSNTTIVTSANVYYNITALGSAQGKQGTNLNGFSNNTNALVANIAGLYQASLSISANGAINDIYNIPITINGVEQEGCEPHIRIGVSTDIVSASANCLIRLNVNDAVYVQVKDETSGGNIDVRAMNLNLWRIGN